ncbi:hypothetical protein B0T18DRAFT_428462 [Schizothecium vesticola]|uniref:Uncharacterized protein n=1 Tax=Schizothecium vesticola TaxID=314040 RepID=A0AA40F3R2_9PEZI|nr:hypothetical protein B0T18DRAFT_428462 [Schizothecium vesticola]
MGPFPGTIHIHGNRHNPEKAVQAAIDAGNHQSTDDDIQLSIFAGGSFSRRIHDGSYAIVWNRPIPGAPDHAQEEHREAWYAEGPGLNSVICELLALLLALRSLKVELERIMAFKLRQRRGGDDHVVCAMGRVFTDSLNNLQHLTTGCCANPIQADILRLCFEAAHELHVVPALSVRLELRWLPSHMEERLTPLLHWKADTIAYIAREGPFPGDIIIAGNCSDPYQAVHSAQQAEAHHPTLDNMQLAFFVDGSHNTLSQSGGYGVVWNRYDAAHQTGIGVAISGQALTNNICELLAIIEALQLMKTEFTRMMAARAGRRRGHVVKAMGRVFSDSRSNCEVLRHGTCGDLVQRKLVEACFEVAHELQTVPGLRVGLELRWVPGRMPPPLRVEAHRWADRLGGRARGLQVSRMFTRQTVGDEDEQVLGDVDSEETFWARFQEREGLMGPVNEGPGSILRRRAFIWSGC